MEITVEVKTIYGRRVVYPFCDKSKVFCRIARTQSLTNEAIDAIKALGVSIIVHNPTVKL